MSKRSAIRSRGKFCRRMTPAAPVLCTLVWALIGSCPIFAQANLGRILGTVRDESGAIVPGATVVIADEGRGMERTVVSDDSGEYLAPSLSPGTKTLHAERTGFKSFVQANVLLEVGQDA